MSAVKKRIVGFGIFLAAFGIYVHQAAPSITTGDSGEFITSAGTLSLAHAPSFPLFMILSRSFLALVPWGSIPYRVNIFSAFLSSLALFFIFQIAWNQTENIFFSCLLPFLMGFTASFWANTLVTEVFALNTLLVIILIYCLQKAGSSPSFLGLFVFLLGLGLGNHHILIAMAPAFLFFIGKSGRSKEVMRNIPLLSILFILGFSIYLALPIRASQSPPLNWGNPNTVERFVRTLTRKDYGSFTLAIGQAPPRTLLNSGEQLARFFHQLNREAPWPLFILGALGLGFGFKRDPSFYGSVLLAAVFSGPLFYLMANLPLQAQSEGIMGRFFIMPAISLLVGWTEWGFIFKRTTPVVVLAFVFLMGFKGYSEATLHRSSRLAWDYGNAMLRTLPPHGILFMDGGDDAFYGLACLHYVMEKRPDVELHDRGGLVYKNIYGDDFRRLTREEKKGRRFLVEKEFLKVRPVFYSSMDSDVMPGVPIEQVGFLLRAGPFAGPSMDWPLLILRSLYPLEGQDYRTRALAAFFPYMRGRAYMRERNIEKGLVFYRKAAQWGKDVDWFQMNAGYDYAHLAYDCLTREDYPAAEKIYLEWLSFDPMNYQAQSNYGVALEKQGRLEPALRQYHKTAALFPTESDPVFNIAVALWPTGDWPRIRSALEETLRRNPRHPTARRFLSQADAKIAQRKNP